MALAREDPVVGANALQFRHAVVSTAVKVYHVEHVEHRACEAYNVWRGKVRVQAVETVPEHLDLQIQCPMNNNNRKNYGE